MTTDPILSPTTRASVEQGLRESAAGQTIYLGSFKKAYRPSGTGIYAAISRAKVGDVLWTADSLQHIRGAAHTAKRQIEVKTCWAVEIREGKAHKVVRVEVMA